MIDNVFVPGLGGELEESETTGDTFKLRSLKGGGQYRVLKNYFSHQELARLFSAMRNLEIWTGQRYWSVTYEQR